MAGTTSRCFAFDLGGVLVQLAGRDHFSHWSQSRLSERQRQRLWHDYPALIDGYERGGCSTKEFIAQLIDTYSLPCQSGEMINFLRDYVVAPFPGARQLLLELRNFGRLACLSNTNSLHWQKIAEEMNILDCFDHLLPSHLIKCRKPDPDAYFVLIETLQAEPADIFFFDDLKANVSAAGNCGIRAFQVAGVSGVRAVLPGILEDWR